MTFWGSAALVMTEENNCFSEFASDCLFLPWCELMHRRQWRQNYTSIYLWSLLLAVYLLSEFWLSNMACILNHTLIICIHITHLLYATKCDPKFKHKFRLKQLSDCPKFEKSVGVSLTWHHSVVYDLSASSLCLKHFSLEIWMLSVYFIVCSVD